jgi:hypothetical protein
LPALVLLRKPLSGLEKRQLPVTLSDLLLPKYLELKRSAPVLKAKA